MPQTTRWRLGEFTRRTIYQQMARCKLEDSNPPVVPAGMATDPHILPSEFPLLTPRLVAAEGGSRPQHRTIKSLLIGFEILNRSRSICHRHG